MTSPTLVLVPGMRTHVPEHWQTHLRAQTAGAVAVPPIGSSHAGLTERVDLLDRTIAAVDGPVVLVAHSAGVLVTVHWAAGAARSARAAGTDRPIVGALLVTPPDLSTELPPAYPSLAAMRENGWLPIPSRTLPFPSIVAASTNDALGAYEQVQDLADAWGSRLHDLGPVGHMNPAAGFGEWPGAQDLIDEVTAATHTS